MAETMIRPHVPLALLLLILAGTFAAWTGAEEMNRAVVPGESRPTGTRLEEARKRLAAKKWAEGIALLQAVIDSADNDLVAVTSSRSVSARRLAHFEIARSGAECLALYRKRIDSQAQRWLDTAVTGDPSHYHRIVEEAFCSKQVLVALDRLGDQAFERGRFAEAELWWRLLAPLPPHDGLAYPDPPAALVSRVQAKQLLARLHQRASTWKNDLKAYRKRHPDAAGALAGRKGTYADILAECARQFASTSAKSGDWPTFGGSKTRGDVIPAGDALMDQLGQFCRGGATWRFDLGRRRQVEGNTPEDDDDRKMAAARCLAFYPVVVGHTALVADARYITAYDLKTGKSCEWYDVASYFGGLRPQLALPGPPDLRYTLTVAEGSVFARMGTQTIRDIRPDVRAARPPGALFNDGGQSVLVSLSLKPGPEGHRRRWFVSAVDLGRKEFAVFEGAPVVVAGRVYIAATRFVGDKVVTAIHCYPANPEDSTAPLLWKTDVCDTRELLPASSEVDAAKRQRTRHHLLTVAGPNVVYCSHSGAVVALDSRTGRRAWAVRYPRRDDREPADEPTLRDLVPCLFADGRLYVAPNDSDSLLCLDPATGESIWTRESLDVVHLLGVGSGRLIFSTWRNPQQGNLFAGGLRAVDAADGGDVRGWSLPDDGGGLLPFGRGLLMGDLVLWPTARRPYGVFAVRQEDGLQPDNPALLHRIPSGNLVFANDCLLVTDRQYLWAFVPPETATKEKEGEVRATKPPTPAEELALLAREGNWRTILNRPNLCSLSLLDARGVPRLAQAVARRELQSLRPDEKVEASLLALWNRTQPRDQRGLLGDFMTYYPDANPLRVLLESQATRAEKRGDVDEAALNLIRLIQVASPDNRPASLQRLGQAWQKFGYARASRAVFPQSIRKASEIHPPDADPSLALPLDTTSAITLSPDEKLLPGLNPEGPAKRYLWSIMAGSLVCRHCGTGEIVWSRTLSIVEPWAKLLGNLLLIGDARAIFAFEAMTGTRLWMRQAPPRERYPQTARGRYRAIVGKTTVAWGEGILVGTHLVIPQDKRSLLAIDVFTGDGLWQRQAPGAAFEMPFPRGSVATLALAGPDHLLAQVSGRRWLLDAGIGEIREQAPTELFPWRYPPVTLEGDQIAVPVDRQTFHVLDILKAKVAWVGRFASSTLSSGDPPMVVSRGSRLVVVESLNFGLRLSALDRVTGKEAWPKAVFVPGGTPTPETYVASREVLYHATDAILFARSLGDGRLLWKQSLDEPNPKRLILAGSTLLCLARPPAREQIQFRSPVGSLQYQGGSLANVDSVVTCFDATSGEVVQRIHLEHPAIPPRLSFDNKVRSFLPRFSFERDHPLADAEVRLDDSGLVVGMGSKVKIMRSRAPTPEK